MVLQYWRGKDSSVPQERTDAAAIQRRLYAASAHGIYASAMESYLRESGFQVFALQGRWSDLREQLAKGRPLIAGLKLRSSPAHYVVVVGVGPDDQDVLLNDPERGKLVRMERGEFEKAWHGTQDWTLLAVPQKQ